jgi:hypothetical protein
MFIAPRTGPYYANVSNQTFMPTAPPSPSQPRMASFSVSLLLSLLPSRPYNRPPRTPRIEWHSTHRFVLCLYNTR